MGPAYRLLRKSVIEQELFSTIYSPIKYLSERSRPFNRMIHWYLSFWYSDEREIERHLRDLRSDE